MQPVSLIILSAFALNNMEGINDSPLLTKIFLALVKDVAVNEDQRPGLDLTGYVVLIFSLSPVRSLAIILA